MKLQSFPIQPPTPSCSVSSPVIPPPLSDFVRAVEIANSSKSKKMTVCVNVETQTEEDHVNDQADSVNDQDDSGNDQDGENGKFLQFIYKLVYKRDTCKRAFVLDTKVQKGFHNLL